MPGALPTGIDQVNLQPGSHVCAFYRGDDDRDRLLNGYLGAGLTAEDKCICIVNSLGTQERLAIPAWRRRRTWTSRRPAGHPLA